MEDQANLISRRGLVAAAGAALFPLPEVSADGQRVVIKGVPPYGVYDPIHESIRAALAGRRARYSTVYIQGISGAGFRIGGPCPCAPTCSSAMPMTDLLKLLGYEAEALGFDRAADPKARLVEVLPRIKAEIRAGRPVLVFNAFTTAEWDVVCGYDDTTHEFLGRGAYGNMLGKEYARADQGRMTTCAEICGIVGAMLIGARTGRLDARRAEVGALREAVRHANDRQRTDYPFDGLAVYDHWLESWRKPDAGPEWGRDGYTTATYSSTHKAGAQFLRSMKRRYPKAADDLDRAATHLAAEADSLHAILAMLFPPQPAIRPGAAAVRGPVVDLLLAARADYAAFADALGHAVAALPGA